MPAPVTQSTTPYSTVYFPVLQVTAFLLSLKIKLIFDFFIFYLPFLHL